jgi:hypothetical protein
MIKRETILLIPAMLIFCSLQAQKPEFKRYGEELAFIEVKTDTTALMFIKTFDFVNKPVKEAESLFHDMQYDAKDLKANCYRVMQVSTDTTNHTFTAKINLYSASESLLKTNYMNHENNIVYIFPDKYSKSDVYDFKVNHNSKTITKCSYSKFVIPERKKLKVNKGGLLGLTIVIPWVNGRNATYIAVSQPEDNEVQATVVQTAGGSALSLSNSANMLNYFENDLARFLVMVYKHVEWCSSRKTILSRLYKASTGWSQVVVCPQKIVSRRFTGY